MLEAFDLQTLGLFYVVTLHIEDNAFDLGLWPERIKN